MKTAIIGTGISGTSIAYLLHRHHDITVYEKNDYIGGHSRTKKIKIGNDTIPVDTGFIVFNKKNYPLLTALFDHLNVPITETDMSFGVDIENGWLEYGTHQKLSGIFAQKKNILKPKFWHMLSDIKKFNTKAPHYLKHNTALTLGELLNEMEMGTWFRDYYLLAMGAAIWSTPTKQMLDFPAYTFLQFFKNHGLLTISDHPQWYTVTGGSQKYVEKITAPFKEKIRSSCTIKSVTRYDDHVIITDNHDQQERYDSVIFACHSDQALKLLKNPTRNEKNILGDIKYQPNKMILHTDINFMPRNKKAWASWVYQSAYQKDESKKISLSYWMNNLQPLQTETPVIVTLNPANRPQEHLIRDEYTFEHPIFDQKAIQAQKRIPEIQGKDKIWYCGAWQRYGFHEDGLLSAVNVAKMMGIEPQWT